MNIHDATETAYRNGYVKGKEDAATEIFEKLYEILRQHTEGGYYLNGCWFPTRFDLYTEDAIAELKKKYTGEK